MTDAQSSETKQGPPDPQAAVVESPTPPGGPLRQDATGAGGNHAGHDDEASGSSTNDKHASESGGNTIAIEDEQPRPQPEAGDDDGQEENAETSLDQPSEG